MNILLVAGGKPKDWPLIDEQIYDYFVGIDRGSLYILEAGWPLDLAVGDFDSLSKKEFEKISHQSKELLKAQAEKDDTDTQLALALTLKKFPKAEVKIIGATGGRLDHFLSNLWLPLDARFQPFARQISLLDNQNTIQFYLPGSYLITKEAGMKYLAYICLTPIENLSLVKSKYTLKNQRVDRPISYSSNEFVGETAEFSFDEGLIAVIQSKDRSKK